MKAYLDKLRDAGELLVVEREVNPRYELAAVTKKAQLQSDRPLLFRKVTGSRMPVVTNLFNSRRRLSEMTGAPADGFCRHWSALVRQAVDGGTPSTVPAEGDSGRHEGRFSDLPQITYHGKDAGPYVTSAIYLAKDPDSGVPNLSFHRSMVVSDEELRIRIGSSHDLATYQKRAEAKGEALEAALLIGVDPAVFLAACTSIPPDQNELDLAARIAGGPIAMEPCAGLDLAVPASTQIVVEGRILPHERRREGPFGEFLGYYVPEGENHVFQIERVRYREDAVYHSLLCGSAEDLTPLEAVTAARVYRHLVDAGLPGIVDVSCSPAFMNTTIKIRQQHEGHARQVMLAAFGANMDYNRAVFVVDEDIDITDMNEVMWAFLTRGRVDTRVLVLDDVPGFYRDPHKDYWGRIGVDATMPLDRAGEFERKSVPGVDEIDLKDYLADPSP